MDHPKKAGDRSVAFYKLFSFADGLDLFLMLLGSFGAVGNGIAMPLMTIIFGQLTNAFGESAGNTSQVVDTVALRFLFLGCGSAIAALLELCCWMCTGERQAARIRSLYLKAILRQDIPFFDTETNTGEVMSRMSGDTILIQEAMGEKVGKFIQLSTTFLGGFVIAFVKGWRLALVLLSVIPLLVATGGAMAILTSRMATRGQMAYAEAGTLVEQIVGGIRTVASFGGEKQAVGKYDKALDKAYRAGVRQSVVAGAGLGALLCVVFGSYAFALWYGSKLILHRGYTGGDVLNVIFAVLTGGSSLGQASPCISAFAAGRAAACKMFEAIHRKPSIDASDMGGLTPDRVIGDIELRSVSFRYPARPEVAVFDNFSLAIPSGITAALVGESGSGKSTVVSLIERFYDPQAGAVLLDGIDVRRLQVKWLREQIGLVSQEPVLFGASIKDNISYGKDDATDEEIKRAAALANASKFIDRMPQGYSTHVGDHGTQLSGGQKQRIAIARAILKNPRILLLDEATSALDAESERVVQDALDGIMVHRTTVIVAHRLSTIKNANCIAVVQRGNVVEKGTHSELLQKPDGAYSQLVRLQEQHDERSNHSLAKVDPDEIVEQSGPQRSLSRASSSRGSFGSRLLRSFSAAARAAIEENANNKSEEEKPQMTRAFLRLAALNKPEAPLAVAGGLAAAGHGVLFPLFGLLLSNMIGTFFETSRHKLRKDVDFWSAIFTALAAACLIVVPAQIASFGLIGQRLIRRIRRQSFGAVVRQDIGWFDDPSNSSGAISARLSTDAAYVRSLVGDSMSLAAQNVATIVTGLIIAFAANWTLALLILALVPLLALQGATQTKMMTGFSKNAKETYQDATKVANDAVSSIRTVASYCMEQKMVRLYTQKCEVTSKSGIRNGMVSGAALGFSNFVLYGSYALSFWYGARLVEEGKTTFQKVFRVFFAITMSALGVSQAVTLAPDLVKVKASVRSIFATLDRKSKIDPFNAEGKALEGMKGDIEFRHVSFRYPSRPDAQVFRDMCFSLEAGKTMALVGESGSGKSTVIALLERFYDPDSGEILIDGINIKTMSLRWLRQHIGLVSQEPILFSGTIRSNIAYAREGRVAEEEIEAAATTANAHKFISALPDGYNTQVGDRGMQLSGGQKQRVAIARAVAKEPRILLLDEATSALDAESESVVQEALDRIMVGKTTIIVAHRLSTIVGVDVIAVVNNGVIVERGSHSQLMSKPNGAYASLVKLHLSSPAK
ncbi:ATP-binding cassette transporter [Selaginella moellendorffii]|uniref:ATP-binding cassette transporter n=1 Tax=Selaginella moellendorffii TaxID=88036 RepID=D8SSG7_SELML|nr:ATP-binding cassette transporter [Selaginella moellendorffii]